MAIFVEANCGCTILSQKTAEGNYVVVKACDRCGDYVDCYSTDRIRGIPSGEVSPEEEKELLQQLRDQLCNGRRFAQLKDLLTD